MNYNSSRSVFPVRSTHRLITKPGFPTQHYSVDPEKRTVIQRSHMSPYTRYLCLPSESRNNAPVQVESPPMLPFEDLMLLWPFSSALHRDAASPRWGVMVDPNTLTPREVHPKTTTPSG